MARRVALVTGGARRVGAEIVRSFAVRGYDVVLHHGSSPDAANALTAELQRAHDVRIEIVQEDIADVHAPQRIIDAAMRAFGALDVVVSSASVMMMHPFDAVTPDEWDQTSAINLRAPFFLMQAAARVMRDGGVIVQLSDHLAFEAIFPHLIPHQVTKSALTQLVRTTASAFAPRLRVNAVAPGLVLPPDELSDETIERFLRDVPLGRSGTPLDVAQAIHFLVDAPYVTGIVLPVDGGRHLRR
ncbi:SDR family oxidoreductase [Gemmatimonas groenlandica]|uniref:SDR family oxidoreductase n=1 Tax=Gemmatimonas groenlandica TaxID=2732249 RepID=A0A6M4IL77_9BACT|nr:SDR family oxidoreductase [Gemmatimonas groenlandica]QJR34805.1 SDR family oxidoreductase [Gemmatimonas groenlandica]